MGATESRASRICCNSRCCGWMTGRIGAAGLRPRAWLPNLGSLIMQGYELSDFEWGVIAPLLPNKPRGVPRVDDRRVLNGIFWVLRTGAPWRALPNEFGPRTTCCNRFVRCP